jgi:hypothetical protein
MEIPDDSLAFFRRHRCFDSRSCCFIGKSIGAKVLRDLPTSTPRKRGISQGNVLVLVMSFQSLIDFPHARGVEKELPPPPDQPDSYRVGKFIDGPRYVEGERLLFHNRDAVAILPPEMQAPSAGPCQRALDLVQGMKEGKARPGRCSIE